MKGTKSYILLLALMGILTSCYQDKTSPPPVPEYLDFNISGIATDPIQSAAADSAFAKIADMNANAVSFQPKAVLPAASDSIEYDRTGFAWGETSTGIASQISMAKANGLKVLLDPWIEFPPAESSATYDAGDSATWALFERSYMEYIIHFAEIAETEGADIMSLGSDMENFIIQQDTFWTSLVDSVKQVFSGELTYGSNWKNYDDIPFWGDLDYVGIEAYWSVSLSMTPDVIPVENYWQASVIQDLSGFSSSQQRDILFTKIGYRSIDFAGEQPWDWQTVADTTNHIAQNNCLSGFFEAFRERDWFEGAFIRGWTLDESNSGSDDDSYSPQGKAAEALIREAYLDMPTVP